MYTAAEHQIAGVPASDAALCGLVLAAGAGTRYGAPKALAVAADGTPWVALAERMLRAAGCTQVLVALGAAADEAAALVPAAARTVLVPDWQQGLSASLRAGLTAATGLAATTVMVAPVDTPAAPAAAAIRVRERASAATAPDQVLARATYAGRPGHPVLIGRAHWDALRQSLGGDAGAGPYLTAHGALAVECGDLWSGADVDRR